MSETVDPLVARAFEGSAIVRAIERGANTMRSWGTRSAAIALGRSWIAIARSQPGQILLAATLTHLVLMLVVARPLSWYWLLLPAVFLLVSAVLIASTSVRTTR